MACEPRERSSTSPKRSCASAPSPSASAAKPMRQNAVIIPQRWLTSEKASWSARPSRKASE
jgi:hypothetical protein